MASRLKSESPWRPWRELFEKRSTRRLPTLPVNMDYSRLPKSLARSLAIFQLGESGGGTIIGQAAGSGVPGIDADYAKAMSLFVDEEHRHANILAMCVRLLDGRILKSNWTARLFVWARRLIGLRLKVLVLLVAEVVGICYYEAIANRLPASPLRRWLHEIVEDERSHLEFHCAFLRSQVNSKWRRRLFVCVWRCVMIAAAIVVMLDHRRTIRDMSLGYGLIWQRWMAFSQLAERLVVDRQADYEPVIHT